MSATSVQVTTWSLPNEDYTTGEDPQQIPADVSYHSTLSFNIRSLSTHDAHGSDQTGLLYTPDLKEGDSCIADSAPYVQNVTRIANLPPSVSEYRIMAIAPWTSSECALNYMVAARDKPNNRGFIFFVPGNSTQTPPAANDPQWHIEGKWKRDNGFPVYAIPGHYGAELMNRSALYNANVTDVPRGHELTESGINPTDYVRLFADIDTGSTSSLPSLWVFLLIVLAVLLAVIAATSLSMHLIQRRRRRSLRRRIASGEVDLEALGIKRLTIPQDLLDKMPTYIYGAGIIDRSLSEEKLAGDIPAAYNFNPSPLSQPTCPICLEDFEVASAEHEGSTVRELPCHHIFHPECVDSFLRLNSSLCPMCKKSALPKGYCPKLVTSAMVRRERNIRRIRANMDSSPIEERAVEDDRPGFSQRIRMIPGFGRRFSSAPLPVTESQRMEEIDMRAASPATAPTSPIDAGTPPTAPPARARSTLGQREWARQRALAMLGRTSEPVDPDVEESNRTSGWRKAVRGLFPGFGR